MKSLSSGTVRAVASIPMCSDSALLIGRVATSPVGGLEPVHMVSELSPKTIKSLALKPSEVRALGWRWPRRWITLEQDG